MQVHLVQKQNNQQQKATQFKGAVDASLRFLATNQGVGANLTDLSFMVIPRIATDAKRGPEACLETARREASGTTNHSLIGVYGLLSGLVLAGLTGINKKFGTKANSMFTAPETLNILAENKAQQVHNQTQQFDYLKETLSNLKAYNPTLKGADKEGFVKLSSETIDSILNLMDNNEQTIVRVDGNKLKEIIDELVNISTELDITRDKIILLTPLEVRHMIAMVMLQLIPNLRVVCEEEISTDYALEVLATI